MLKPPSPDLARRMATPFTQRHEVIRDWKGHAFLLRNARPQQVLTPDGSHGYVYRHSDLVMDIYGHRWVKEALELPRQAPAVVEIEGHSMVLPRRSNQAVPDYFDGHLIWKYGARVKSAVSPDDIVYTRHTGRLTVTHEGYLYTDPDTAAKQGAVYSEVFEVLLRYPRPYEPRLLMPDMEAFVQRLADGDDELAGLARDLLALPYRPDYPHHIELTCDSQATTSPNYPTFQPGGRLQTIDPDTFAPKPRGRQSCKPARLLTLLLGKAPDPRLAEAFATAYKLWCARDEYELRVVRGDELLDCYNSDNYCPVRSGSRLHGSCMGDPSKQRYLYLYSRNPEVCGLLVAFDRMGRVAARRLIWTSTSGETYADEVYFSDEKTRRLLEAYAEEQGWPYPGDTNVQLSRWRFNAYPYLDTLRYLNPGTGLLSDENTDSDNYSLDQQDGSYSAPGLWSEWEDNYIDEDDAVWSEAVNSYLHIDRSVRVEDDGGVYPKGHNDIVYCPGYGYYLAKDAVYSKWGREYIPADMAVEVGDDYLNQTYCHYLHDRTWAHRNDCVQLHDGTWALEEDCTRHPDTRAWYLDDDYQCRFSLDAEDRPYASQDPAQLSLPLAA